MSRYLGGYSRTLLARLINRLRLGNGGIVSNEELLASLYFDRWDGGPLYARNRLKSLIMALRAMGFPIALEHGRGYRYAWIEWEVPHGDPLADLLPDGLPLPSELGAAADHPPIH